MIAKEKKKRSRSVSSTITSAFKSSEVSVNNIIVYPSSAGVKDGGIFGTEDRTIYGFRTFQKRYRWTQGFTGPTSTYSYPKYGSLSNTNIGGNYTVVAFEADVFGPGLISDTFFAVEVFLDNGYRIPSKLTIEYNGVKYVSDSFSIDCVTYNNKYIMIYGFKTQTFEFTEDGSDVITTDLPAKVISDKLKSKTQFGVNFTFSDIYDCSDTINSFFNNGDLSFEFVVPPKYVYDDNGVGFGFDSSDTITSPSDGVVLVDKSYCKILSNHSNIEVVYFDMREPGEYVEYIGQIYIKFSECNITIPINSGAEFVVNDSKSYKIEYPFNGGDLKYPFSIGQPCYTYSQSNAYGVGTAVRDFIRYVASLSGQKIKITIRGIKRVL